MLLERAEGAFLKFAAVRKLVVGGMCSLKYYDFLSTRPRAVYNRRNYAQLTYETYPQSCSLPYQEK